MLFHQFWMAAMADSMRMTQAYMDACYTVYRLSPLGMMAEASRISREFPKAPEYRQAPPAEEPQANETDEEPRGQLIPFRRPGP